MKKNSFLHGALLLIIAAIVTKVVGAFYRIPLTNLIGAEGMGLYQIIFPLYHLYLSEQYSQLHKLAECNANKHKLQ